MATVYKFEITSHWINYHPADMKKMIEKALYSCENEITVNNLETESERLKTRDKSARTCSTCYYLPKKHDKYCDTCNGTNKRI